VRDEAREKQGSWGPRSEGWDLTHPGRRPGRVGLDRGLKEGADLDPPGGWALVLMVTVAAITWGMFLIGQGQP